MPRQHVLEPPARWAWSWPSQSTDSTGFTLSPVTLWEQPSVLHRSAQNGTGARKEMCRCSDARAEPCQKNTTNITSSENMREHGFHNLISRLWPNPALRRSKTRVNYAFFFVKPSFLLYDGNWHCLTWSMAPLFAPFSQPLVRLKHFLAFPLVPCECCGTQSHPE